VPSGYEVECSFLTVPENRSNPDSPTIRLQVAVFKSFSDSHAPDPVIYLAGGPGGSGVAEVFNSIGFFSSILEQRDLVVLDQRGTGTSQPSLACPEYPEAYLKTISKQVSYKELQEASMSPMLACEQRLLNEGVDLSAYNNVENAADVDALRQALGYKQWNLLGVSYGTRVALTVLREFPGGVRSAILDSTFPPEIEPYSGWVHSQERAIRILFESCARNEKCSNSYPNLEQDFYSLLDTLDANPLILITQNPSNQQDVEVMVDGDTLLFLIFNLMYDSSAIARLPLLIEDTLHGDTGELSGLLPLLVKWPFGISWGLYYSVACPADAAFTSYAQLEKDTASAQPRLARPMLITNRLDLQICESWSYEKPDLEENQPVKSSVPTLILAGDFDPATPPEWGQGTASLLEHAYFYKFPGLTHGVMYQNTESNGCNQKLISSFLQEPNTKPDDACVAELPEVDFVVRLSDAP
jgi:pimeloyl-ACP methyl ester carboxylesterase